MTKGGVGEDSRRVKAVTAYPLFVISDERTVSSNANAYLLFVISGERTATLPANISRAKAEIS